jgi:hypothetical protein
MSSWKCADSILSTIPLKSCLRSNCGIPEVLDDEDCADDNDARRFGTGDVRSWGVEGVGSALCFLVSGCLFSKRMSHWVRGIGATNGSDPMDDRRTWIVVGRGSGLASNVLEGMFVSRTGRSTKPGGNLNSAVVVVFSDVPLSDGAR